MVLKKILLFLIALFPISTLAYTIPPVDNDINNYFYYNTSPFPTNDDIMHKKYTNDEYNYIISTIMQDATPSQNCIITQGKWYAYNYYNQYNSEFLLYCTGGDFDLQSYRNLAGSNLYLRFVNNTLTNFEVTGNYRYIDSTQTLSTNTSFWYQNELPISSNINPNKNEISQAPIFTTQNSFEITSINSSNYNDYDLQKCVMLENTTDCTEFVYKVGQKVPTNFFTDFNYLPTEIDNLAVNPPNNLPGSPNNSNPSIGLFSTFIKLPLNYITALRDNECTAINIPFKSTNFVLPCISTTLTGSVLNIRNIVSTLMTAIICYYVIKDLFFTIKNFKEPEKDKIEVIDL